MTEPSSTAFDDSNPPDWKRLSELGSELDELKREGKWNKAEFDRLYAEGQKAANGHEEFLEFLINEADEDWL